jgi:site-specific recombinase XerD
VESDKICYLIPSLPSDALETFAPEPGKELALPIVPTPETGWQTPEPVTATLIPAASRAALTLPPVLLGSLTPAIRVRVEHFYSSVYEIFQRWVNRPKSLHTRRSYKDGVLSFVRHRGMLWPQEASTLLMVSVAGVQAYRDALAAAGAAPKTINHRVSALSSFYKYLALSAAELRLPIIVPNPAHSQFIARESSDPREETLSLPAARARQLLNLPIGDSALAHRDRAIVKLYLYSGIRLAAGCYLLVEDFRQEGEEATLRLREKGDKRRTIGLHYVAAQALHEYIHRPGSPAGRSSGRAGIPIRKTWRQPRWSRARCGRY